MKVSSVIIYTAQLLEMKAFYETLGFKFKPEKHGDGPEHFSTRLSDSFLLELYPLKLQTLPDVQVVTPKQHVRIELVSGMIGEMVNRLIENGWTQNMGFRDLKRGLYLIDPDGNEVMVNLPKFPTKINVD